MVSDLTMRAADHGQHDHNPCPGGVAIVALVVGLIAEDVEEQGVKRGKGDVRRQSRKKSGMIGAEEEGFAGDAERLKGLLCC